MNINSWLLFILFIILKNIILDFTMSNDYHIYSKAK